MSEVFNRLIKEDIQPILKARGFKKQNLKFYKQEGQTVSIIQFQKSQSNHLGNMRFYVNVGIFLYDLKENAP